MGRSPCCDENGLKKGPWTPEEDQKLVDHIQKHGHGSWRALPKLAGLNRCGKSCRLRWTNYLRPDIKRGKFSQQEEETILHLHSILGNKWSAIATHLPGRTDNEIKNFWNTHLKKKLIQMGFDPMTHQPRTDIFASLPHLLALANLRDLLMINHQPFDNEQAQAMRLQAEAAQLAKLQYLQCLVQSSAAASYQNNSSTDIESALSSLLNSSSSSLVNYPSQFENQIENNNANINVNNNNINNNNASSQPLHHNQGLILSDNDIQVPFDFQTSLKSSTDDHEEHQMGQGYAVLEDYNTTAHDDNDSTAWIMNDNSVSNINNNNQGDASSTTSSYPASSSSFWHELCLDEPNTTTFHHDFS
ncbi:hypothetical protein ACFE04_025741 [Oxalis oulophora]